MFINGMTLRHLRYADALARHGHFGHAARHCAVTQPALSMQIKELEQIVGTPLFERSHRRVEPTEFGHAFVIRARAILSEVAELEHLSRAARDPFSGTLRLGVIPTIAPYLLPAAMDALGRRFPDLQVSVRETVTSRLIEDVRDSRLDVAVLALPVSHPALTAMELLSEQFVLIRPSRDAGRPVPNRRQLREMRLLLLEEGHCFRDQALSFCDLRPADPREVLDASALTTLVQMVAAGMGVTLIPQIAVGIETERANVDVVRFPPPEPTRTIGLVWRSSSPLEGRFREIGDVVRQSAQRALDTSASLT